MDAVLREFLDENLYRSFPLLDGAPGVDTTGSFTLPSNVLSDIFLCIPDLPTVYSDRFFIRRLVVLGNRFDLYIGYRTSGDGEGERSVEIGVFRNCAIGAEEHLTYQMQQLSLVLVPEWAALDTSTGQVIVGFPRDLPSGEYVFTWANTRLLSTRISRGVRGIQYIDVDGVRYTGNIRLVSGGGYVLSTSVVGNETIIYLGPGSGNIPLTTEAVIDRVVSIYGAPITTINNIPPDSSGNFEFRPIAGETCVEITPLDSGIAIGNPCATPCCDPSAEMQSLLNDVQTLSSKLDRANAFASNFSTVLASISSSTAAVESMQTGITAGALDNLVATLGGVEALSIEVLTAINAIASAAHLPPYEV